MPDVHDAAHASAGELAAPWIRRTAGTTPDTGSGVATARISRLLRSRAKRDMRRVRDRATSAPRHARTVSHSSSAARGLRRRFTASSGFS